MYAWLALPRCKGIVLALSLLLGLLIASASGAMPQIESPTVEPAVTWQPWHIIDTRTGHVVAFPEWIKALEQADIIYLGEEHHNPYHIEAALKVLNQLLADRIYPTIGMEMFGWDGQEALDSYVSGIQSMSDEFLEEVRWKQNWGGEFSDYGPLVTFARERQLPVRAMNPPKPLIRRILKLGLEPVKHEPEWAASGMAQEEIVDDPAYHTKIIDQLRRCHGGTEEHYRTMYEASMVRDEGMAKTLVQRQEEIRRAADGLRRIILSYTGGGHIQYGLPVPKRVARRLSGDVTQTTVYMMSFEPSRAEDVQAHLDDPIADYLWLTPMGKPNPTKPCK